MDSNIGENYTGNYSTPNEDSVMKFCVSEHLKFVIFAVLIVFMNSFVILLFFFNKILQKPCNFLLVSLSVSDLLTGLVGLPLVLVCSTTPICLPCVFSFSFIVFTSISTVLHILVISYERYIKIVFPFRMQQIGRRSFELKLVACLWLLSLLIPPVQYFWLPPSETLCLEPWTEEVAQKQKIYTITLLVLFVGLPLILLIYADVSVFFVVRRQLAGIDKTSVGVRDSHRRLKKETRVLTLFAIMTVYFFISWSVYYAGMVMHSILEEEMLLPDWFIRLVAILRTSTPMVNPVLYILLKHDFRRVVCGGVRRWARKYSSKSQNSTIQFSNGSPTLCQISDSRNVTERTMFL